MATGGHYMEIHMAALAFSPHHNLRRHQKLSSLFLLSLVAVTATACTAKTSGNEPTNASSQAEGSEAKRKPLRNLNPSPKDAVHIRIKVTGAPGALPLVDAAAQYDVSNSAECGKLRSSGAFPTISSSEAVELTKVADDEYAGVVYMDRIIDEDYYGRGVCHWEFVEARASFRASEDVKATWFVVDLPAEALEKSSAKKLFYWTGYYPGGEIENYAEFGNATLEHVPAGKESEYFTIEISADGVES